MRPISGTPTPDVRRRGKGPFRLSFLLGCLRRPPSPNQEMDDDHQMRFGHYQTPRTERAGFSHSRQAVQGGTGRHQTCQRHLPETSTGFQPWLKSILKEMTTHPCQGLCDKTLLLGFAGAFRRSELIALNLEALNFTDLSPISSRFLHLQDFS